MPLASVAAKIPLLLRMKCKRRVIYRNAFVGNSLGCSTSDRGFSSCYAVSGMLYFVRLQRREGEEGGGVRALREGSGGYVAAVRNDRQWHRPTEANTSTYMTMKYEEVGRIALGLHLLYVMSRG